MKKVIPVLILFLSCINGSFAATWQPYRNIQEVVFEGAGASQRLVVKFTEAFHSCGWNTAANLVLSDVGDEPFKALAIAIDGCSGDRAKIIALSLKP